MAHSIYHHTLILVLLCFTRLSAQDLNSPPVDSTMLNSTAVSEQLTEDNLSESSWIKENAKHFLGPLLGSFLAGLIALYSVHATHSRSIARDSVNSERLKQERQSRYCGLLYSIHAILRNHDQLGTLQRRELSDIQILSLQKKKLVVDNLPTKIPLALLEKCLLKLLDYEFVDTHLMANIITYQHSAGNFNTNLDFAPIIKLQSAFKEDDTFADKVKEYFDQLFVAMDRAKDNRAFLLTAIETEFQRYPFVHLVGQEKQA